MCLAERRALVKGAIKKGKNYQDFLRTSSSYADRTLELPARLSNGNHGAGWIS